MRVSKGSTMRWGNLRMANEQHEFAEGLGEAASVELDSTLVAGSGPGGPTSWNPSSGCQHSTSSLSRQSNNYHRGQQIPLEEMREFPRRWTFDKVRSVFRVLLKRAGRIRKCIIGVGTNQPNRANNEDQNDGQHHGVLGDVLTFVFIPQF